MVDQTAIIYGLETKSRALCTLPDEDNDNIRFLVGTQSFRMKDDISTENQIHRVTYDDERNTTSKIVYTHTAGEIWSISTCTADSNLISTCFNKISGEKTSEMRAAVWRLPEIDDDSLDDDSLENHLEKIIDIGDKTHTDVKSVLFHPNEANNTMISLNSSTLYIWDLRASSSTTKLIGQCELEGRGPPKFTNARWDPHHKCSQIATCNDTHVRGWDLRSLKQCYCIENAHGQTVRDLDFNPNRQYILATCGDDCRTKFWDVRNPEKPLKILDDHSHWVWSVRYNNYHDQLVLTASSDSRVVLNNVATISSEPFGKLLDEEFDNTDDIGDNSNSSKEAASDRLIQVFDEHEDSVYAVEWSTSDPWVFASLSYDGRLVINHVPRAEKYRILL